MLDIFEEIVKLRKNGEEGVLITTVVKDGHGPTSVGSKMLIQADGTRIGTVGGGALEYAAIKKAGQIFKSQKSRLKKYLLSQDNDIIDAEKTGMMCGGSVTLFFEYIGAGVKLYIIGAGHIGQALVDHLQNLNYFITLVDSREGFVGNFDNVQQTSTTNYDSMFKEGGVKPGSFFVIVSHSHVQDYLALKRIYESNWKPKYVGLIASKKKCHEMINRLSDELGGNPSLESLYSPMGLNIGGQAPDEIAISIIAELQAVRYNKENHNHMRDK
ncbi:MAG: XdhC family protein [bacterium]|nr:XdhC family protein [bacterium]